MKQNHEILTDYIDRQLDAEQKIEVENMLKKDVILARDLEYMKLAVETIRRNAIESRVSTVRKNLSAYKEDEKKPAGILRTMYQRSLRVAAVFVCLLGLTILYKYSTTNASSLYEKQFSTYELVNTRGIYDGTPVYEAFQNKQWQRVIDLSQKTVQSNKTTFLAGISAMQLGNFQNAVVLFKTILNEKNSDPSFHEEAEYYLALAYLKNQEQSKGIEILKKIKNDPGHRYYPLASHISRLDLKIVEFKQ